MTRGKEILEELKTVGSGKTFDALLPPLFFIIIHNFFGLDIAVAVALIIALVVFIFRLVQKQAWRYALGGLLAVTLASGLAYLSRNAASYYIPSIINSTLLYLLAILSIFAGKPIAAWASHLTRGWPIDWFWHEDVKPAYMEVTWAWTIFFAIRLAIQIIIFQSGDATRLAWANILLGWPALIVVLILTYIYGTRRLHRLGGPSVEEFKERKERPWQSQIRGF